MRRSCTSRRCESPEGVRKHQESDTELLNVRATGDECKKSWLKRSFSIANTPAMCKQIGGSRWTVVVSSVALVERLSVRGRFKRQPHIKLCAIWTRAEVDFSVMPFDDDPVADNQAESGA